jgi:hypothetical protein
LVVAIVLIFACGNGEVLSTVWYELKSYTLMVGIVGISEGFVKACGKVSEMPA